MNIWMAFLLHIIAQLCGKLQSPNNQRLLIFTFSDYVDFKLINVIVYQINPYIQA